jgi:hypothetical protein
VRSRYCTPAFRARSHHGSRPPSRQEATGFAKRSSRPRAIGGPPWVNDRINPWRPFVYVPRAFAIDALIREVLGEAVFAQITLR